MREESILVNYRRILLTEKIRYNEENLSGHKFLFDKKGVYKKFSKERDRNTEGVLLINYGLDAIKVYFPVSDVYRVLYEKHSKGHDICYIYKEVRDENEKVKYLFDRTCTYTKNNVHIVVEANDREEMFYE